MAEAAPAADTPKVSRLDRRKARTRQALIDAAVRLIAEGRGDRASIAEITEEADIGFGSFYNHFDGKEQLFATAAEEVLEWWGQLIDRASAGITDPAELAREATAGGADALGMAGGDGSLAVVAAVAAAHGIPFVCVPAGTRNHFALDVGVDRHDVIGALDAFTDGVERQIDIAEVNGRAFLNNASLGIYGDAVRSPAPGRLAISAPAPPRPPSAILRRERIGARHQQEPCPTGMRLHPGNPRVSTLLRQPH
jgi:AcrR family transcriptional regulator